VRTDREWAEDLECCYEIDTLEEFVRQIREETERAMLCRIRGMLWDTLSVREETEE